MIRRLILLGVCALATGAGVRVSQPGLSSRAAAFTPTFAANRTHTKKASKDLLPVASGRAQWQTVWTRSAPRLQSFSLASNGSSVAWVDDKGSVRRVLNNGRTLWQTAPLPGVNRVQISGLGVVVAWGQWNPAAPSVRLLDGRLAERRSTLVSLDGAVWDLALTPDGTRALVSTGRDSLYLLPLRTDAAYPGKPIPLPGIAESVAYALVPPAKQPAAKKPQIKPSKFAPASSPAPKSSPKPALTTALQTTSLRGLIALGTWQDSGVAVWDGDKTPKWRHRERLSARSFHVQLSQNGSILVAVSGEGPLRRAARLHVWNATTGQLLWVDDLQGYDAKTAVSANGDTIAVTWAQLSEYRTGTREERRVVLYDRLGRRRFEPKGGHFFAPDLVALSPDGKTVTVRDNTGTLWSLDERGTTVARLRPPKIEPAQNETPTPTPAPAPDAQEIKQTTVTPNGKFLLVYRGDGQMTLYQATKP